MPQPAPISSVFLIRLWSIALMLRMKNSELEFGKRMIDPGRDVDHQAVGQDALGHGLTADQGVMGGGDVENRRIHQFGQAQLAKDGLPRADPVLNIHGVRL